MSKELFAYIDNDGDSLRIVEELDGIHAIATDGEGGKRIIVSLGVVQAHALRNALTEWLYPENTASTSLVREPFTAAEVREMAREEFERLFDERNPVVSSILPLHQSPQAYVDAGRFIPDPDAEVGWWPVGPEPHDVGHPEPAPGDVAHPRQLTGCTACGHGWGVHWKSKNGCTALVGVRNCPCTRIRPTGLET